ncbi:hypothetical protein ACTXT7_000682 [Hymenolepis weldensis]
MAYNLNLQGRTPIPQSEVDAEIIGIYEGNYEAYALCEDLKVKLMSSAGYAEKFLRRYKLPLVDDNKLKAVQNTARWMMLGLYSRRQVSVKVLAEKVPLRNLAAQIQKRLLNLWARLHKKDDAVARLLLNSQLPELGKSKISRGKSGLKQLNKDAKWVFDMKEDAI